MKTYIIALKELNISNELILNIIEMFKTEDYLALFNGAYINLQFKYNLKLDKYAKIFTNKTLLEKALSQSREIQNLSKEHKVKIALINSKRYPSNLKTIKNPPAVIYYKGRGFYKKHIKSVACIGTRSITDFGVGATEAIVPKLTDEGFTIVSGLAYGVDTLSHKCCLKNNGTTIAVLAHGLDMIYPKSNEKLAMQILENNGLLVSEYPVGVKPDRFRFVERNRITSGLSEAIVVFEAKRKSGTMHTVDYAIEQNKLIFCPLPQNESETTSALSYLIDKGIAISIPFKNSFETIVLGLDYKLKDKKRAQKVRNQTISELINNTKIHPEKIDPNLNYDTPKYSGVQVDNKIYEKYRKILKENNLTNKDLLNAFILSIVKEYEK